MAPTCPGQVPGVEQDLQELSHDTLDAGSSVDDFERRIGQLHLAGQDLHGALRWLDGVLSDPQARNNCAVALFHLQRVVEALPPFFVVGRLAEQENLFALSWAIQLQALSPRFALLLLRSFMLGQQTPADRPPCPTGRARHR